MARVSFTSVTHTQWCNWIVFSVRWYQLASLRPTREGTGGGLVTVQYWIVDSSLDSELPVGHG